MDDLKVGSVVKGVVTGIESYGIFVKIDDNHSGLIHISSISDRFIKDINRYANVGEEIYVEITNIENDKLILSVKGLNYRSQEHRRVKESVRGFTPLKQHLPIWIEEKYHEIHEFDEK